MCKLWIWEQASTGIIITLTSQTVANIKDAFLVLGVQTASVLIITGSRQVPVTPACYSNSGDGLLVDSHLIRSSFLCYFHIKSLPWITSKSRILHFLGSDAHFARGKLHVDTRLL